MPRERSISVGNLQVLKSPASDECVRVFVAEDNAADVFWLEMVFKGSRIPYAIEIAADAETASKYLDQLAERERSAPDLILFGGNLPGAPSIEALDRLASASRVPLFVMVDSEDRAKSRRFLRKPFTHSQLQFCLAAREKFSK